MHRVAIIHPWMPQYRRAFFETLVELGHQRNIRIDVFYGDPPLEWRSRKDATETSAACRLPTKFFRVGHQHLVYKSLAGVDVRGYDLIVIEQAVRNLETYLLLLRASRKLAFWGHGRTYTKRVSSAQEKLKMWLTSKGSWFFAYTPGGARAVINSGFPASRVTTVFNSTDSKALRSGVAGVTPDQTSVFINRYGLSGKTALYIGGLDGSKRIDFILAAAREAHDIDSDFRLLIAGSGDQREVVEHAAAEHSWIAYLGPIFGQNKYVAMTAAKVLFNPGRVGLVAVDSFAAGVPIATVDWRWHAPEAEYLVSGENALITTNDVRTFAREVITLLNDDHALSRLRAGALAAGQRYTMENMVANFLDGLSAACVPEAGT